jgi:UDP-N-acetylmuramoyl-L-alanyl-D-glutamate--2,6-diaminopimelate ligase
MERRLANQTGARAANGIDEQAGGQALQVIEQLRAQGVQARALATDSRAVTRGDIFLAYPGERSDGRLFIADAIAREAAAVLWERDGFEWNAGWRLPNLSVNGLRSLAGPLAHEVYGRPSERLWIMGVTGTNGKGSTSQWLAQACTQCGARTALVGTLGIGFPGCPGGDSSRTLEPSANTTPDAVVLHRALATLLQAGAQGVAMEVSSIGIEQGRVNGVAFGAALFTNLSRDHLDFHGDMESYARAKQKLFQMPGLRHAVLNLDDVQGVQIGRLLSGSGVDRVGYSCCEGVAERAGLERYVEGHDIRVTPHGIAFTAKSSWGETRIENPLLGRFNVANLLGALGTMLASGVPFDRASRAISGLTSVTGRMQRFGGDGRPLAVVDYAHTPDALEQVLVALKDEVRSSGGQLIVVFGCGGERDRGKRALMGAIAARHADRIVVTSDNPRGEDPCAIIADIVSGITVAHQCIVDRGEAIAHALQGAREQDVVLLAGKGHEAYQVIGGSRIPFSDAEHAALALEGWTR